jgi:hypothetical protein
LRGVCRAVPQTVLRIGYVGIHGTNDDETYPIAQTTPTYICTPPRASRCRPAPTPECCRSLTTSTRTIDRIQRVRHRRNSARPATRGRTGSSSKWNTATIRASNTRSSAASSGMPPMEGVRSSSLFG